MGNWQGFRKHGHVRRMLMACLTDYVVREGATIFESLHQAGLTSVESFYNRLVQEKTKSEGDFDILNEVRQMLEGG